MVSYRVGRSTVVRCGITNEMHEPLPLVAHRETHPAGSRSSPLRHKQNWYRAASIVFIRIQPTDTVYAPARTVSPRGSFSRVMCSLEKCQAHLHFPMTSDSVCQLANSCYQFTAPVLASGNPRGSKQSCSHRATMTSTPSLPFFLISRICCRHPRPSDTQHIGLFLPKFVHMQMFRHSCCT